MAGYNVSTIVLGSAQAGQASLVQGTDNNGLFHRYLEGLFNKLDDGKLYSLTVMPNIYPLVTHPFV